MSDLPTTYTFYQSNIDPQLVEAQAAVFHHLGIPLVQELDDKIDHSGWLTRTFRNDDLGPLAVVADIDAFPLSLAGYQHLIAAAEAGSVAGLAQVANHKNPDHIYAAPMFLAARRDVYKRAGAPEMRRTERSDVAQILTLCAEEAGIPIALIYPKFCIAPRWSLAQYGVYGIGTFYGENAFFHLFEARRQQSRDLFLAVAQGVINGHHDFDRYMAILDLVPPKRKKFLGLF
ncbi:hypothetical protein [Pararhodobacter zhoushanensis]|uniref:hypothetical protein n=1 Tax=Pararhodobacter zhoushanensis TaxID=2479545 RepID=UPI000F8E7A25|nr:hypothetical protein [Pararhodobacter zhoushanensis]